MKIGYYVIRGFVVWAKFVTQNVVNILDIFIVYKYHLLTNVVYILMICHV